LLIDISECAHGCCGRGEFSINRAGQFANGFLKDIKGFQTVEEIAEEVNNG